MGTANRLFMVIGLCLVICYTIAQVRPLHENLVRVEINGLRNNGCQMMDMLFSWAQDFPKQADRVISEPPPVVGASNNAKGRFGPPKFDAASLRYTGQLDPEITITYL
jgi:uncharacterized protein (DUF2141 family)